MEKRINVMGAGPGWENTPIDNGEIWAVNNCHLLRPVDRIIDIHPNRLNPDEQKDQYHMYELRESLTPTYANDVIDGFENVQRYPIENIKKEFGGHDYFGSGIDYIIALAIYEKATEIHLYGVSAARKSEYAHQKPSIEFWCGVAVGRGIELVVHGPTTEIMRTHNGRLYGYGLPQKWLLKEQPEQYKLQELLVREMQKVSENSICN